MGQSTGCLRTCLPALSSHPWTWLQTRRAIAKKSQRILAHLVKDARLSGGEARQKGAHNAVEQLQRARMGPSRGCLRACLPGLPSRPRRRHPVRQGPAHHPGTCHCCGALPCSWAGSLCPAHQPAAFSQRFTEGLLDAWRHEDFASHCTSFPLMLTVLLQM